MSGVKKLTIGLLLAAGFALAGVNVAEAGTFTMKQCVSSGHLDFQGNYGAVNGSTGVDVINGCTTSGPGKIGIYQDRSGGSLSFGEGGQFNWSAPVGTQVVATQFSARLKDANGIDAALVGFDGRNVTNLDGGVAHDGSQQLSTWSGSTHPQTLVLARLTCSSTASCENKPTSAKAFMEVTDVEFTVRDVLAPTVAASGELWTWAGDARYHRGSASIRLDAADQGSGVAAAWVEANGLRVDFAAPSCPGHRGSYSTRFAPCPPTHVATTTVDTAEAPFREGPNQIRLCARDYAAAETDSSKTCSPSRTLLVDNEPSHPPANLRSDQGMDWQPGKGFNLRWGIPGGQVAPVIGAVYLLHDLETGAQADAGFFGGEEVVNAGTLEVPEVGAYRATIHLVDQAGNLGEPADTLLRYDDRPPGDVSPEPPSGWISRDELPIRQQIQKAEPGGPSGISGYALSVSKEGPTRPCGTWVCLAPEITLAGGADLRTGSIGGLSEGSHWVSSAAVSGARRSSIEPGSTMVRVDRTPPSSFISGVPNEWVNHPVTLTVQASDQLSGMRPEAGDDGEPRTVIDADHYAAYSSPGAVATFAVATEGVNRIRYWAEDLAGNANDGKPGTGGDNHPPPGQAVVRIDTTPPRIAFDPARDPEDPEIVRISAEDADSGVASATVWIREAGSGEGFEPLPTTGGDGRHLARVPSDDLPRGTYELRATAEDRAGNRIAGNETSTGEPMILNLPLKRPAVLTATLARGKRSLRTRYGARQFVEGRLASEGLALANHPVRIVETFVAGSRNRAVVTESRTDGDGRYRVRLGRGPSRRVEAFFGGTSRLSRASGPLLRVEVKGRVRFRVKPGKLYNGGVVRMEGAVGFGGALPPARGKLVAIEYLDPARGKWRPVEVLRTNRRGRFRYGYRFRTISAAQRIVFRAVALPEAGWPYLPSTSGRRSVIVYPKEQLGR